MMLICGAFVLLVLTFFFVVGGSSGWGLQQTCTPKGGGEDSPSLLDYASFYSCSSILPDLLKTFFLLVWLLLMISLLATTADSFFVPQLEALSHELGLAEDVAGVTLLALGNGMPDVMTANSALTTDDFALAMGEFFGAANFIMSFVLGFVLLASDGPTEVQRWPIMRDGLGYGIVVLWMTLTTLDGYISFAESITYFVIYAVYIAVAVLPGRGNRCTRCCGSAAAPAAEELQEELQAGLCGDEDLLEGIEMAMTEGPLVWAQLIMELPFTLLRHVSIPAAKWNKRRRLLSAICPTFGLLVAMLAFGGGLDSFHERWGPMPSWLCCVLLGLAAMAGVLLFSSPDKRPRWHLALLLFALVSVVGWFNLLANECVAILQVFGLNFGISSSVIGITVLAWGNSVGDFVADTALARKGRTRTAVAGCFGSPLLSDLLGLGVALTSYNVQRGSLHAQLSVQNKVAAAFLVASLVSTLCAACFFNFTIPRRFAYLLLAEYAAFMFVSVFQEVQRTEGEATFI